MQTTPKAQSCWHLCQATAYLNFNSSLGILHVLQSCVDVQCHDQPRGEPQGVIGFTRRLNDIRTRSVELQEAKRLPKIREGKKKKREERIITVLNREIVRELWIILDTARNY